MSIFIKPNKTFLHFFSTLKALLRVLISVGVLFVVDGSGPRPQADSITFSLFSVLAALSNKELKSLLNHQTIDKNVCFTSPDTGAVSSTAS